MDKPEIPELISRMEAMPTCGTWLQACGGEWIESTGAVLYIRATAQGGYEVRCHAACGRDVLVYEGKRHDCYDIRTNTLHELTP